MIFGLVRSLGVALASVAAATLAGAQVADRAGVASKLAANASIQVLIAGLDSRGLEAAARDL